MHSSLLQNEARLSLRVAVHNCTSGSEAPEGKDGTDAIEAKSLQTFVIDLSAMIGPANLQLSPVMPKTMSGMAVG
jgi:hypothetical protein